jgi:hypothetical protein
VNCLEQSYRIERGDLRKPFAFPARRINHLFMPAKKKTSSAKSVNPAGNAKTQHIAKTGLTSRVRGHVSARGKRAQGRRDSR